MCGEKYIDRNTLPADVGSPPHMRGKACRFHCVQLCFGITPAHAGKRTVWTCVPARSGDHPRTCGEKIYYCEKQCGVTGSPPHMRGKDAAQLLQSGIPMDHPRTCGEKSLIIWSACGREGSPPHMRGKVITYQLTPERSGITPAHAGKSDCRHVPVLQSTDHPRTCGEKYTCFYVP